MKILSKPLLLLLILLIGLNRTTTAHTQEPNKKQDSIYFSGKIVGGAYQKDSLWVSYTPNLLTTYSTDHLNGQINFYVKPDKDGNFHFHLPAAQEIGNLVILIRGNPEILGSALIGLTDDFYPGYLVENGDRISMAIQLDHKGNASIQIQGKSSEKYLAINGIRKAISLYPEEASGTAIPIKKPLQQLHAGVVIRTQAATAMLKYYRHEISPRIYQILNAEIQGMQASEMVIYLQEFGLPLSRKSRLQVIKHYLPPVNLASPPESAQYINYLIRRTILQIQLKKNSKNYHLEEVYQNLKNQYIGKLREKLLSSYLLHAAYRYGADKAESSIAYEKCMLDAFQLVKNPLFKKDLGKQLSKYGQGSPARNFDLPNSVGTRVQLTDFKGKVVLIDIYGTICSGCRRFAMTLKEKVFPVFKDNPDVVFVAISTEPDRQRWLQDIEDGHNTSKADEIILYTEGLGTKHPYILNYNINAVPTLLLIDREGKIANSSAVSLNSGSSGEEVIDMIVKALDKKTINNFQ